MSNFKFMFGLVAWHTYMTGLRQTVAKAAIYQAKATREVGYLVADEIRDLSDAQSRSLRSLEFGIELGFALLGEKLERQTELLGEISDSLTEIRELLSAPERTRANEQFKIGKARLDSGLLKEALAAFLRVEEINEVDPVIQLVLGKIYLYGVEESESLIDLVLAEKHLLKAIRYSKLVRVDKLRAEIVYHAAVLFFVLASESRLSGDGNAEINLGKARELCEQANSLSPYMPENRYLLSKIYACDASTIELAGCELLRLFSIAPFYALLAQQDDNFLQLNNSLAEIEAQSRQSRLRLTALQIADGIVAAEEEAKRFNAENLASARFQVLNRVRKELEYEIRDGLGYVPRNIAEGMHLATAFYELAIGCRPCFDFTRNIEAELRYEQQKAEERLDREKREARARALKNEIKILEHRVIIGKLNAESWTNRFSRKLNGPTQYDQHLEAAEQGLLQARETLQILLKEKAGINALAVFDTPPKTYSLRLDELSIEDCLLIRQEDEELGRSSSTEEAFKHRQWEISTLASNVKFYKDRYHHVIHMMLRESRDVLASYPAICSILAEQYLSGKWKRISFPNVPQEALSKLNLRIEELAEEKGTLRRAARGFEPMYYNLPITLFKRINPENNVQPEYLDAGPEHATLLPDMLPHNLLQYRTNSHISVEIRPEPEFEHLFPDAKSYLANRLVTLS